MGRFYRWRFDRSESVSYVGMGRREVDVLCRGKSKYNGIEAS